VYLRTLMIVSILGILVMFALLNWSAFTAPTALSVGLTTVEAPLGLLLLGFITVLTVMFLVYIVYLQSATLLESRRQARELQAQREVAENAETSRFHQLRTAMEAALREQNNQALDFKNSVLARLEELERELRSTVERSGNSIAAYLGEIEDRLERAGGEK
jgi:Na+-transporting methylmalonyl-CoA/oxaloacetate decarboxylase gamma subunit